MFANFRLLNDARKTLNINHRKSFSCGNHPIEETCGWMRVREMLVVANWLDINNETFLKD